MAGTIDVGTIKVGGLAELKAELRAIKGELANATDPEQMQRLAEAAGAVSDQIKDANEQVAVFATGSKFEATSNAFGLMKSQLMDLDFEGAANSAKMFQKTLSSITPAQIGTQIKGLISVVGSLSKAFISFGLSLLANPIFLIAAAIAAIVAVVILVMNKLGILKPILKKIGEIFQAIGIIIDIVVQALKDFSDWLGLTANAAEDSAERQIAASEKTMQALDENSSKQIHSMENEIELMKARGKYTAGLEAEKQKLLIKTAEQREKELKSQIKNHKYLEDLDEESMKKLVDKMKEQKTIIQDAQTDLSIIYINEGKRRKEIADKQDKDEEDAAKKAAEKAKEYAKNRLEARRQIKDLEIELMKEGEDKELEQNRVKYERLKEDTLANDKLIVTERNKLLAEYKSLEAKNEAEIKKKYDDEEIAKEKAKQDALLQLQIDANAKRIALEDAQFALQQELDLKKVAATQGQDEANRQKEKADLTKAYEDKLLQAGNNFELEKQLREQRGIELDAIDDKYRKLAADKEEADRIAKIANVDKTTSMMADATKTGLQGISDIVGAFAGKSVGAQKKAFETQKKINIVMATIDMIKGAVSAFSNAQQLGPIAGPIVGGLIAASVVASGIANIKKISATKFEGGGGGGAPSAPSTGGGGNGATSGQATPSFNLFGQSNNMNSLTSQKPVEASQMTVKAVVVESDVTNTQNKVKKMQESATL
jgi:hypothetical protein